MASEVSKASESEVSKASESEKVKLWSSLENGKDKEEVSGESGSDVDSKSDHDSGDEKQEGKTKRRRGRKVPLLIPSLNEYFDDMRFRKGAKTLVVGNVTFAALAITKLGKYMCEAETFNMNMRHAQPTDKQTGYVELKFFTEEEAEKAADDLQDIGDEVKVIRCVPEGNKSINNYKEEFVKSLRSQQPEEKASDRTLCVGSFDASVKESDIKELFPTAASITIPYSFIKKANKGYAYIEFKTPEEAKAALSTPVKLEGFYLKVCNLVMIPAPQKLITNIDSIQLDKSKEISKNPKLLERLRGYLTYITHYNRVDYVKESQLKDMQKREKALQLCLKQVKKHLLQEKKDKAKAASQKASAVTSSKAASQKGQSPAVASNKSASQKGQSSSAKGAQGTPRTQPLLRFPPRGVPAGWAFGGMGPGGMGRGRGMMGLGRGARPQSQQIMSAAQQQQRKGFYHQNFSNQGQNYQGGYHGGFDYGRGEAYDYSGNFDDIDPEDAADAVKILVGLSKLMGDGPPERMGRYTQQRSRRGFYEM